MSHKKVPLDDPIRFKGDKKLSKSSSDLSKQSMAGYYELPDGYAAKYSLSTQKPSARYAVRGYVALVDPLDGSILKTKVRKKDAGTSGARQLKEARSAIDTNSTDETVLRKKIADAASRLYSDHILVLADSAEKSTAVCTMPFPLIVAIHADRYLNAKSKSAAMRHTRYLRLKKVASLLENVPLDQLSQRTIKSACRSIGSKWRDYINEAASFLSSVYSTKRDCVPCNPFDAYLEKHPLSHQRNTNLLQRTAANTDILSTEEESSLNKALLAHPENGLYAGICLIKDGHLASLPACSLLWKDIVFIKDCTDTVLVRYQRDQISGATHCYDFPIVGIGAAVLHGRYHAQI